MAIQQIASIGKHIRGAPALSSAIVVCSYPRSGSTWLRTVMANAAFFGGGAPQPTLRNLDELMPVWGYSSAEEIRAATVPLIKTHRSRTALPLRRHRSVILLAREPIAVLRSAYRYYQASMATAFSGTFDEFMADTRLGVPAWIRYHRSFERWPNVLAATLDYDELRSEPVPPLSRLLVLAGRSDLIPFLDKALAASSLDAMQRSETEVGVRDEHRFRSNFQSIGGTREAFEPTTVAAQKLLADAEKLYQQMESTWKDPR